MWTEEGSFGNVDFTGIRSLWDGLDEPAEWLLKYQRNVESPASWLTSNVNSPSNYVDSATQLPPLPQCPCPSLWSREEVGSDHLCKREKRYLWDVRLSLWKVWFKSINLDKWYVHWWWGIIHFPRQLLDWSMRKRVTYRAVTDKHSQWSDSGPIKMWKFDPFFIGIWFFDTQNTFYLILKGLKNAFFMPFSWLSKWGATWVYCESVTHS